MATEVNFPERTIAQVIAIMRNYCRVTNRVPYIVAIVEGTSLERDAWRKVANDYLIAKAQHRNVDLAGNPIVKGEEDGSSDYDFASECDRD